MIENRQEAINDLLAELANTQKACCWRDLAALRYSVEGDKGSDVAYNAGVIIGQWGYEDYDETAWELISKWNRYWAQPEWSERDLRKKLRDGVARAEGDGEFGMLVKPEHQNLDLEILDVVDFMAKEIKHEWLIKDVVVASQPLVISGPQKCLKTSMLLDMAISLATGTPFLGQFSVPRETPSLILSGESGGATLQDTIGRICDAKQVKLARDSLFIGERLPQLSVKKQLATLGKDIRDRGVKFCAIDPAYLCILQAKTADQSSNIYAMGTILAGLGELGASTGCTIAIAHHHKKGGKDSFGQPSMTDLSGAGWIEWMRQWLLLNHRERMRAGLFRLWLGVGGSAGHNGMYAVDVNEGTPDDPLVGRTWDVSVRDEDTYEQQQSELAEQQHADELQQSVGILCSHLRGLEGGVSRSSLKDVVPKNLETALMWGIRQRRLLKTNDGKYVLRDEETDRDLQELREGEVVEAT